MGPPRRTPGGERDSGRLRRTFSSLQIPAFRRYFAGNLASLFGFWIRLTVQGWLVWRLSGREEMLGAVTAVGLAPFVLFSLVGGVLGDRVNRRLFLATVPVIPVCANILLGWLVLSEQIELWHVFATAFLVGSSRAMEIPIRNAFVRDLAGLEQLPNAIALNAACFQTARVAGPAAAAVLMVHVGIGWSFVVAAVLNGSMILALVGLRVDVKPLGAPRGNAWQQLAEGLRYVRGHRRTRTLVLLLAITLLFAFAYQSLMPSYADKTLRIGKEGYGTLMSMIGVGALAGALWVAGRGRTMRLHRGVVFGVVWTWGALLFALGFVERAGIAIPLLIAAGFCQVAFMATAMAMVQQSVPDAIRGRVMGLWAFTFGVFFPLGSLLMGAVAQRLGLNAAWSGGAAAMLVLSFVVWLRLPPRQEAEAELEAERARLEAQEGPGLTGPAA